jgi:Tfp pilus assembly protein FimT
MHPTPTPKHLSSRRSSCGGFTITELLLVIGIIVLVAIVAVPAFRAMTGSRSSESALNQMSAVLARARTEALGLQQPRGIFFYKDLSTGRTGMAMVYATNGAEPYELDLAPDHDPVLLPVGVGLQFLDNQTSATDDKYIGFNTRVDSASNTAATVVPYGQVILFDGQGRLVTDAYRLRIRFPDPDGAGPLVARASDLGRFLYDDPALSPAITAGSAPDMIPVNPQTRSASVGFVLFDYDAFTNVNGTRTTATTVDTDTEVSGSSGAGSNGAYDPEEKNEEAWLDANATPVLINRYNGTLVRSE